MLAYAPVLTVPLCVLVYWHFSRRSMPEYGVAFGVGYLSHIAGDAVGSALVGEYAYARFLLWPLVSVPVDDQESVLGELVAGLSPSPWILVSGLVGVAVVGLWIADGKPGPGVFRRDRSGDAWRRDG